MVMGDCCYDLCRSTGLVSLLEWISPGRSKVPVEWVLKCIGQSGGDERIKKRRSSERRLYLLC